MTPLSIPPIVVHPKPSFQSDELTAATWVKSLDRGDQLLIGKWDGSGDAGWRLELDEKNPGHMRFEVNRKMSGVVTSTAFVTLETIYTPVHKDAQWHRVTGTYDRQRIQVYITPKNERLSDIRQRPHPA